MPRPGLWLRFTALFASSAVLLAVVSGAASLGAAHRILAALALPPLVALVVAARLAHPRLFVPALSALVLFGIAALVTLPGAHLALAAVAFAATLVATVATYRGEPAPPAPWRDYVTLTKPRIMTLLPGDIIALGAPWEVEPPAVVAITPVTIADAGELTMLASSGEEAPLERSLAAWAREERAAGRMKRDDTTLIALW